jgi:hypothetical protein
MLRPRGQLCQARIIRSRRIHLEGAKGAKASQIKTGCPSQKGNTSWQSVRAAPRTFALELTRAPTRAAAPMTLSTHDRPDEADDRGRSGRALVAVMKPADLGDGDDMPG